MSDEMPRVLIEDWLPIEAFGAESKRERGASSALPPLYFLHVWWARRPLMVSRAAILGSVLPEWSRDWPNHLLVQFPTQEAYQKWFVHLTGIRGDPVRGRKLVDWAKTRGIVLREHPYGGAPRAFAVNPAASDLQTMTDLLTYTWGTENLAVLDAFAGGGSIPFEALRYGFTTIANEINAVASVILKATLDYPARYGSQLVEDARKWGKRWSEKVKKELEPYFPLQSGEIIFAYLWSHTIACPATGKPVPLSPNWWLRKGGDPAAVRLVAEENMDQPQFQIVSGKDIEDFDPDKGTLTRGIGHSPWVNETIPKEYIKSEAQAGRMWPTLYAIVTKRPGGVEFRVPTMQDRDAFKNAERELESSWLKWQVEGLAIDGDIPYGHRSHERDVIVQYGITRWRDMYNGRQLFSLEVYLHKLHEIKQEIRKELPPDQASAVATILALVLDKCADYNSRFCAWHPSRQVIAHTFGRHDFSFIWSHPEFDAARNLLPWAVDQVTDALAGLVTLASPAQMQFHHMNQEQSVSRLKIENNSASSLSSIADGSIAHICIDPPYYNNVNYAELSDYFYVWLKRSAGDLHPQFFGTSLANRDEEAIANPARFHDGKRSAKKKMELANLDYERKMAAAFREMHRVLHPHGVLTVMFTHKRVEAWDTLATALISAGFVIKASWPVHTESEHSLHQAKKNAAASTILLVCRKRTPSDDGAVWWDDLQGQVRRVAREKALEYAAQGIGGVDLYISTFGPTLSVISENWPVLTSDIDEKTGQPRPLRPDTALDLAREEVIRLRKEGLLAGKAIEFDPVTDWYLMAWDAFKAEQFPYDEARKLAIALGLEVDDTLMRAKRLVTKKGQYVVLQAPAQRRRKGMVDPDVGVFEHWIDALHTAMMVYDEDGAGACDVFLMNRGLKQDTTFKAGLQALINAIPRTKVKNKFVRPEADILDRMRLAFYADELTVPPEEEPALPQAEQLGLFDGELEEDFGDEEVEDEE